MVMEHYHDRWSPYVYVTSPFITHEEVAEFRRLLDRAREYDARNNEPDCEVEDKKRRLLDLARELGIESEVAEVLTWTANQ